MANPTEKPPVAPTSDSSKEGQSAQVDPIQSLRRMSTTAGLGSGDYVAINVLSVLALLLGIGSFVMLFGGLALLFVPAAAIVCGIVSFIQVRNSNRTQTGAMLSIIGIVAALGLAGYALFQQASERAARGADEQAIVQVIRDFGQKLNEEDYTGAYALTGARFRERISQDQFSAKFDALKRNNYTGKVTRMDWNGTLAIVTDPASDIRFARGMIFFHFEKPNMPNRFEMVFRRFEEGWRVEDIPDIFPSAPPEPM